MTKQEFLDGVDRAHNELILENNGVCIALRNQVGRKTETSFCRSFKPYEYLSGVSFWLGEPFIFCKTTLTRRLFYLEMFKEWALYYESYLEY